MAHLFFFLLPIVGVLGYKDFLTIYSKSRFIYYFCFLASLPFSVWWPLGFMAECETFFFSFLFDFVFHPSRQGSGFDFRHLGVEHFPMWLCGVFLACSLKKRNALLRYLTLLFSHYFLNFFFFVFEIFQGC